MEKQDKRIAKLRGAIQRIQREDTSKSIGKQIVRHEVAKTQLKKKATRAEALRGGTSKITQNAKKKLDEHEKELPSAQKRLFGKLRKSKVI